MNRKKLKTAFSIDHPHWVGDGFFVYGLLRPTPELHDAISPFILMDYAAPKHFDPSTTRRGVGEHPHRGFETVTLALQGEVEHMDSAGGGGVIQAGDVQWMTAGRGIVHDEFHSTAFSQTGGTFEMIQLWVNLPKAHKMTQPKYQSISRQQIPHVTLGEGIEMRVIAGEYQGHRGPASTFTEINMFEMSTTKASSINLGLKEETNTILLILRGKVDHEANTYGANSVMIFERQGNGIELDISEDFRGCLLNGQPIDEPIVAHGPFVMNSKQEIIEAIKDFQEGKMGKLGSLDHVP